MIDLFSELAIVLLISSLFAFLLARFKQPLILAYIASGLSISAFGLVGGIEEETLPFFASLGIALLLFLVGLEIKIRDLLTLGRLSFWIGIGQIFFTAVFGFIIAKFFGFSNVSAIYLALALTFSSTVVVIKLLSEKRDLDSLYGKITVSFLLVQDFVAVVILLLLGGVGGENLLLSVFSVIIKGSVFLFVTYLFGRFILPRVFLPIAHLGELLVTFSLSWAFVLASFGQLLGFPIEVGAFLAGVSIGGLPYHYQIAARVRPLRDFFVVIFFILLGFQMSFSDVSRYLGPAIVFSIFVLLGTPLIVLAVMGYLGFRRRTAFFSSVAVAQISEFSLILVVLGARLGHITQELVSLTTLIALITIGVSTYMIKYTRQLYTFFNHYLDIFEKKTTREPRVERPREFENHIILVGADRMGRDILRNLEGKGEDYLVVDFNPEIVKRLTAQKISVIFGDATDPEVLSELNLSSAKLILSTVPDVEDNAVLITEAKKRGYKGPFIVTSEFPEDAVKLYNEGADYVILPHALGGKHISRLLSDHWEDLSVFKAQKDKHLAEVLERETS